MKIFITGANGFIGSAISQDLIKRGNQVDFLKGDIRRKAWIKTIKKCDFIIHCAGVHGYKQIPFKERLSIELGGTKNLIEAVKISGAKLIYLSTAYADMATDYAKAKNIAKNYLQEEIKKGLPAIILCPVTVYGPGNDRNLSRLFISIKKKRFFFIGSGKNPWHLIYLEDLIKAINLILKSFNKLVGRTLIVSGPKEISLKKLVNLIADYEEVNKPRIHLPVFPMKLIGYFFSLLVQWGIPVPFTADTVISMTIPQIYPTSKELEKIGFRARMGLEEGIKETLEWQKLS